jgi:hypothetical protein
MTKQLDRVEKKNIAVSPLYANIDANTVKNSCEELQQAIQALTEGATLKDKVYQFSEYTPEDAKTAKTAAAQRVQQIEKRVVQEYASWIRGLKDYDQETIVNVSRQVLKSLRYFKNGGLESVRFGYEKPIPFGDAYVSGEAQKVFVTQNLVSQLDLHCNIKEMRVSTPYGTLLFKPQPTK